MTAGIGWLNRYLRTIADAGKAGVPEWHFNSFATLPKLVQQGLVRAEERTEVVRYYVLTEAGEKAARDLGPGHGAGKGSRP